MPVWQVLRPLSLFVERGPAHTTIKCVPRGAYLCMQHLPTPNKIVKTNHDHQQIAQAHFLIPIIAPVSAERTGRMTIATSTSPTVSPVKPETPPPRPKTPKSKFLKLRTAWSKTPTSEIYIYKQCWYMYMYKTFVTPIVCVLIKEPKAIPVKPGKSPRLRPRTSASEITVQLRPK